MRHAIGAGRFGQWLERTRGAAWYGPDVVRHDEEESA
jgi:hypothetical protein